MTVTRIFTPGPYHVEAGRSITDPKGNVVAIGHARRSIHDGLRPIEGSTVYSPERIQPVEADANAYLLAASWELLDLLKRALPFIEDEWQGSDKGYFGDGGAIVIEAHNLVSKIEGSL